MLLLAALAGIALPIPFVGTVLIVLPEIIVIVVILIAAGMLRRYGGRGRPR